MSINPLKNQKVCVVGLGKTGLSCVAFLQKQGANVRVMDTRTHAPNLEQLPERIERHTGSLHEDWLTWADTIVVSPGLDVKNPAFIPALQKGTPLIGDIELFCQFADKPIIAITGSNGKSTVTTLVTAMARAAGLRVGMGGNIGIPALSLLDEETDLYVLELSSFQLETTYSLRAVAATVLNVSPDHLNRYADMHAYADAKLRIYHNAQTAVVNAQDPQTEPKNKVERELTFGVGEMADYALLKKAQGWALHLPETGELMTTAEMALVGQHNALNALAAAALLDGYALTQGSLFPRKALRETLRTFTGLDHRFQLVGEWQGVRWINDSKATNVGSTLAALQGLHCAGTLHLLLGGDAKGADVSELAPYLQNPALKAYCFGKDGALFAALTDNAVLVETMTQAVQAILPNLQAGDWVLLSPACASLDQFSCFEARGDAFANLARQAGTKILEE